MSSTTDIPSLDSLEFLSYINDVGELPTQLQNQIGIYAVFNQSQILQFVGYSRDIYLSLKQHLVRQPASCYWVKATMIDRPNRTFLESVRSAWIEGNGDIPIGNSNGNVSWIDPIATDHEMTEIESMSFPDLDGVAQIKLLKQVARRVEERILAQLQERGVKTEIRFNPKLKEQGLLDLK